VDTIIDAEQHNRIYLYKIHWMELAHNDDTWELAYHMCHAKEAVKEFHQTHPDAEKLIADDL